MTEADAQLDIPIEAEQLAETVTERAKIGHSRNHAMTEVARLWLRNNPRLLSTEII